MKTFAYQYEKLWRRDHTMHIVRIYRVKKNVPIFIAQEVDVFVDEGQLVMQALQKHKLLPKRAFARNENGSAKYYPHSLKEAGIAQIIKL